MLKLSLQLIKLLKIQKEKQIIITIVVVSTTQVIWSVTVCVTPLIHSCNNSEYS